MDEPTSTAPQMAAPLSPEHTTLHADIEIITSNLLYQFARTISTEISVLFAQNNTTFQIATNSLTKQIVMLGTRVTKMQQQLLLCDTWVREYGGGGEVICRVRFDFSIHNGIILGSSCRGVS